MKAPAPRRPTPVETAPLPAPVLTALRAIRSDLRNLPRDCIVDRAELLHWLNRMARRVEGVEQIRIALPERAPPPRLSIAAQQPVGARSAAEAVFKGSAPGAALRLPANRTVTSRKGRIVRVETRQSGQLGLFDSENVGRAHRPDS